MKAANFKHVCVLSDGTNLKMQYFMSFPKNAKYETMLKAFKKRINAKYPEKWYSVIFVGMSAYISDSDTGAAYASYELIDFAHEI